jgi:hypothetical protein
VAGFSAVSLLHGAEQSSEFREDVPQYRGAVVDITEQSPGDLVRVRIALMGGGANSFSGAAFVIAPRTWVVAARTAVLSVITGLPNANYGAAWKAASPLACSVSSPRSKELKRSGLWI